MRKYARQERIGHVSETLCCRAFLAKEESRDVVVLMATRRASTCTAIYTSHLQRRGVSRLSKSTHLPREPRAHAAHTLRLLLLRAGIILLKPRMCEGLLR